MLNASRRESFLAARRLCARFLVRLRARDGAVLLLGLPVVAGLVDVLLDAVGLLLQSLRLGLELVGELVVLSHRSVLSALGTSALLELLAQVRGLVRARLELPGVLVFRRALDGV